MRVFSLFFMFGEYFSEELVHKVKEKDNSLGISSPPFRGLDMVDVNQYAAWKEVHLRKKYQVKDHPRSWQFGW